MKSDLIERRGEWEKGRLREEESERKSDREKR